jgi:general stress protein YciG
LAGTKTGGKKAAQTNRERHGVDFYQRIGSKGGMNGNTGGFAANRTIAMSAGALGGMNSRRGYKYLGINSDGLRAWQNSSTGEIQVKK